MSSQPSEPEPAPPPIPRNDRELRADARRNRERVLRTAQQAFATQGLGVSLLAVATEMLQRLVAQAEALTAGGDPAALFTLLSQMVATGAENVAVKSALAAAEFDLRTAAPSVAADLTSQVAGLLDRAHAAGAVRDDVTVDEVMALVAGAFAAIRHAGAESSRQRSAHIAQIILDGLRHQPR